MKEDIAEKRDLLLAHWPDELPNGDMARFGVESLWSRRVGVEEMVGDLERLRSRVGVPMLLKLFDFQYMPDGRAIESPAGYKAQQVEVARRMNLPTLDMAPVVRNIGVKRLVADDMMHWRRESSLLQGALLYDAMAAVLGRPRLQAYPASADLRRALLAAFPELGTLGAPVTYPGVSNT